MKAWIKEQLREGLAETGPVAKPVYGHPGTEHKLYTSKHNPNVLYKVGEKNVVTKWVNIFKKYPNFFPQVFKAAELKNHPGMYFVEIEKLNTAQVEKEWSELEQGLQEVGVLDEATDDIDEVFRNAVRDENFENYMSSEIKKRLPALYKLYIKWVNFLHSLENIVIPEKNNRGTDIHRYNFAYDNAGQIKAIDI